MIRPIADYLWTTSRLLADILFVWHLLSSPPCDISCAKHYRDESRNESRKDLSSIHCNSLRLWRKLAHALFPLVWLWAGSLIASELHELKTRGKVCVPSRSWLVQAHGKVRLCSLLDRFLLLRWYCGWMERLILGLQRWLLGSNCAHGRGRLDWQWRTCCALVSWCLQRFDHRQVLVVPWCNNNYMFVFTMMSVKSQASCF